MTVLSDFGIIEAHTGGTLGIEPFDVDSVQPSSYDVHLDDAFAYFRPLAGLGPIDPRVDVAPSMATVRVEDGQPYQLMPGGFVLGSTVERVRLPGDMVARYEGKSSIGRLGLASHITAGFVDASFDGHVTLELVNHAPRPILLWPGMAIGQLAFFTLDRHVLAGYGDKHGSHYQGQRGPTPSRAHLQFAEASARR